MDWDEELIKDESAYKTSIDHLDEATRDNLNKKNTLVETKDKLFCFFERIFTEEGHRIKKYDVTLYTCPTTFDKGMEIFLNKGTREKYPCLKKIQISYNLCIEFYLAYGYYSDSKECDALINIIGGNCHNLCSAYGFYRHF